MAELEPGDVWHSTSNVDIIYDPNGTIYDERTMKIYKKEKEDDRDISKRNDNTRSDICSKW
jgi:hypothetical protein